MNEVISPKAKREQAEEQERIQHMEAAKAEKAALAKRLRDLCISNGIDSPSKLARKINAVEKIGNEYLPTGNTVSVAAACSWWNGVSRPTRYIDQLKDVLHCDREYLTCLDAPMHAEDSKAMEITGLSEAAIEALKNQKTAGTGNQAYTDSVQKEMLSLLITMPEFWEVCSRLIAMMDYKAGKQSNQMLQLTFMGQPVNPALYADLFEASRRSRTEYAFRSLVDRCMEKDLSSYKTIAEQDIEEQAGIGDGLDAYPNLKPITDPSQIWKEYEKMDTPKEDIKKIIHG